MRVTHDKCMSLRKLVFTPENFKSNLSSGCIFCVIAIISRPIKTRGKNHPDTKGKTLEIKK